MIVMLFEHLKMKYVVKQVDYVKMLRWSDLSLNGTWMKERKENLNSQMAKSNHGKNPNRRSFAMIKPYVKCESFLSPNPDLDITPVLICRGETTVSWRFWQLLSQFVAKGNASTTSTALTLGCRPGRRPWHRSKIPTKWWVIASPFRSHCCLQHWCLVFSFSGLSWWCSISLGGPVRFFCLHVFPFILVSPLWSRYLQVNLCSVWHEYLFSHFCSMIFTTLITCS